MMFMIHLENLEIAQWSSQKVREHPNSGYIPECTVCITLQPFIIGSQTSLPPHSLGKFSGTNPSQVESGKRTCNLQHQKHQPLEVIESLKLAVYQCQEDTPSHTLGTQCGTCTGRGCGGGVTVHTCTRPEFLVTLVRIRNSSAEAIAVIPVSQEPGPTATIKLENCWFLISFFPLDPLYSDSSTANLIQPVSGLTSLHFVLVNPFLRGVFWFCNHGT